MMVRLIQTACGWLNHLAEEIDALATARSPVTVKDGWAQRFRDMKARAKQK